jgi:hypothetical protein
MLAAALAPRWRAVPVPGALPDALAGLAHAGRSAPALLLAAPAPGGGVRLVRLEWADPGTLEGRSPRSRLDVSLLEQDVLIGRLGLTADAIGRQTHLAYVKDAAEALRMVAEGEAAHAALLNGTPAADVLAVAEAGETMPQKSTFFYPKLPTGLVVLPLDAPLD